MNDNVVIKIFNEISRKKFVGIINGNMESIIVLCLKSLGLDNIWHS